MSDRLITVDHLWKRYSLGRQSAERDDLRHIIERAVRSPLSWARTILKRNDGARHQFWALRDVTLDVTRGEVVGIVGRNGAGKTTLLKILSRITDPTKGRIRLRGRVASLLEVGTGFHPELTGRENVFLNGAILGMSRADIK
ncbi:MAG TPA: ATP-binding cassette domain-containing protein, partial [Vicinamibacterales bacterium]